MEKFKDILNFKDLNSKDNKENFMMLFQNNQDDVDELFNIINDNLQNKYIQNKISIINDLSATDKNISSVNKILNLKEIKENLNNKVKIKTGDRVDFINNLEDRLKSKELYTFEKQINNNFTNIFMGNNKTSLPTFILTSNNESPKEVIKNEISKNLEYEIITFDMQNYITDEEINNIFGTEDDLSFLENKLISNSNIILNFKNIDKAPEIFFNRLDEIRKSNKIKEFDISKVLIIMETNLNIQSVEDKTKLLKNKELFRNYRRSFISFENTTDEEIKNIGIFFNNNNNEDFEINGIKISYEENIQDYIIGLQKKYENKRYESVVNMVIKNIVDGYIIPYKNKNNLEIENFKISYNIDKNLMYIYNGTKKIYEIKMDKEIYNNKISFDKFSDSGMQNNIDKIKKSILESRNINNSNLGIENSNEGTFLIDGYSEQKKEFLEEIYKNTDKNIIEIDLSEIKEENDFYKLVGYPLGFEPEDNEEPEEPEDNEESEDNEDNISDVKNGILDLIFDDSVKTEKDENGFTRRDRKILEKYEKEVIEYCFVDNKNLDNQIRYNNDDYYHMSELEINEKIYDLGKKHFLLGNYFKFFNDYGEELDEYTKMSSTDNKILSYYNEDYEKFKNKEDSKRYLNMNKYEINIRREFGLDEEEEYEISLKEKFIKKIKKELKKEKASYKKSEEKIENTEEKIENTEDYRILSSMIQKPNSILLFKNVEKLTNKLENFLDVIMNTGKYQLNDGVFIDFTKSLIILDKELDISKEVKENEIEVYKEERKNDIFNDKKLMNKIEVLDFYNLDLKTIYDKVKTSLDEYLKVVEIDEGIIISYTDELLIGLIESSFDSKNGLEFLLDDIKIFMEESTEELKRSSKLSNKEGENRIELDFDLENSIVTTKTQKYKNDISHIVDTHEEKMYESKTDKELIGKRKYLKEVMNNEIDYDYKTSKEYEDFFEKYDDVFIKFMDLDIEEYEKNKEDYLSKNKEENIKKYIDFKKMKLKENEFEDFIKFYNLLKNNVNKDEVNNYFNHLKKYNDNIDYDELILYSILIDDYEEHPSFEEVREILNFEDDVILDLQDPKKSINLIEKIKGYLSTGVLLPDDILTILINENFDISKNVKVSKNIMKNNDISSNLMFSNNKNEYLEYLKTNSKLEYIDYKFLKDNEIHNNKLIKYISKNDENKINFRINTDYLEEFIEYLQYVGYENNNIDFEVYRVLKEINCDFNTYKKYINNDIVEYMKIEYTSVEKLENYKNLKVHNYDKYKELLIIKPELTFDDFIKMNKIDGGEILISKNRVISDEYAAVKYELGIETEEEFKTVTYDYGDYLFFNEFNIYISDVKFEERKEKNINEFLYKYSVEKDNNVKFKNGISTLKILEMYEISYTQKLIDIVEKNIKIFEEISTSEYDENERKEYVNRNILKNKNISIDLYFSYKNIGKENREKISINELNKRLKQFMKIEKKDDYIGTSSKYINLIQKYGDKVDVRQKITNIFLEKYEEYDGDIKKFKEEEEIIDKISFKYYRGKDLSGSLAKRFLDNTMIVDILDNQDINELNNLYEEHKDEYINFLFNNKELSKYYITINSYVMLELHKYKGKNIKEEKNYDKINKYYSSIPNYESSILRNDFNILQSLKNGENKKVNSEFSINREYLSKENEIQYKIDLNINYYSNMGKEFSKGTSSNHFISSLLSNISYEYMDDKILQKIDKWKENKDLYDINRIYTEFIILNKQSRINDSEIILPFLYNSSKEGKDREESFQLLNKMVKYMHKDISKDYKSLIFITNYLEVFKDLSFLKLSKTLDNYLDPYDREEETSIIYFDTLIDLGKTISELSISKLSKIDDVSNALGGFSKKELIELINDEDKLKLIKNEYKSIMKKISKDYSNVKLDINKIDENVIDIKKLIDSFKITVNDMKLTSYENKISFITLNYKLQNDYNISKSQKDYFESDIFKETLSELEVYFIKDLKNYIFNISDKEKIEYKEYTKILTILRELNEKETKSNILKIKKQLGEKNKNEIISEENFNLRKNNLDIIFNNYKMINKIPNKDLIDYYKNNKDLNNKVDKQESLITKIAESINDVKLNSYNSFTSDKLKKYFLKGKVQQKVILFMKKREERNVITKELIEGMKIILSSKEEVDNLKEDIIKMYKVEYKIMKNEGLLNKHIENSKEEVIIEEEEEELH